MRRTAIAFALPFITALMLVQPVSATDVILDADDDGPAWSSAIDGSPMTNILNSNPPIVRVQYFDMRAYSLSLEGDHYRFWMKVDADLPAKEEPLPPGVLLGEWAMWIDPGNYNAVTNPVASLFVIKLVYDGGQYRAYVLNCGTGETTPLGQKSYGYSGSELWMEFPTSVVDGLDLSELWWCASTKVYMGSGDWSMRFVDISDWNPELWGYDIPWPI